MNTEQASEDIFTYIIKELNGKGITETLYQKGL